MGVPLEESREGRTSITPEFMEELESADTCSGTVGYLNAAPGVAAGCPRHQGDADQEPGPACSPRCLPHQRCSRVGRDL